MTLPRAGGTLRLVYAGPFDFGLSAEAEQYTRGFRSTAGIVSPEGVYLAGDGAWYPKLDDGLVEFELTVRQPDGWLVLSEGNGTARDEKGLARWNSHGPTDEIHLVGGPLHLTRQSAGARTVSPAAKGCSSSRPRTGAPAPSASRPPRAQQERRVVATSFTTTTWPRPSSEVQLLVVHGTLHLLGHDHAEPEEKARMWKAQSEILDSLGLGNIQIREE